MLYVVARTRMPVSDAVLLRCVLGLDKGKGHRYSLEGAGRHPASWFGRSLDS